MSPMFRSTWRTGQRLAVIGMVLLLAACASVPRPAVEAPTPSAPPYEVWNRVLQKYVDAEGRVNFTAVARDRGDLDRFVAWVYDNGPENQPSLFASKEAQLAYHINAYNALAMHKVLERGIPRTLAGLRKVSFFYLGPVTVGAKPITLYKYENEVVRKLNDARMHVALNCMSVGCPKLPREAFLPERLNEQLDR